MTAIILSRKPALRAVRRYGAGSYTWTKPKDMGPDGFVIVRVIGAGGAGGGCPATGTGESAVGGGGGAGAFVEALIDSQNLGDTETVTVGAAGAGVDGAAGGDGGTSSFGAHVTASGGAGGAAAGPGGSNVWANGGAGGTYSVAATASALKAAQGAKGGYGNSNYSTASGGLGSGRGAGTLYGEGGIRRTWAYAGNGIDAVGYGSGGGGAFSTASNATRPGGAGGNGVVEVEEYY